MENKKINQPVNEPEISSLGELLAPDAKEFMAEVFELYSHKNNN